MTNAIEILTVVLLAAACVSLIAVLGMVCILGFVSVREVLKEYREAKP